MAGKAILRSLDIISHVDLELQLLPVRIADRGAPLKSYLAEEARNVLFVANPSGLHAQSILEESGPLHRDCRGRPVRPP